MKIACGGRLDGPLGGHLLGAALVVFSLLITYIALSGDHAPAPIAPPNALIAIDAEHWQATADAIARGLRRGV